MNIQSCFKNYSGIMTKYHDLPLMMRILSMSRWESQSHSWSKWLVQKSINLSFVAIYVTHIFNRHHIGIVGEAMMCMQRTFVMHINFEIISIMILV
jgi:hypothetical protein